MNVGFIYQNGDVQFQIGGVDGLQAAEGTRAGKIGLTRRLSDAWRASDWRHSAGGSFNGRPGCVDPAYQFAPNLPLVTQSARSGLYRGLSSISGLSSDYNWRKDDVI